MTKTKYSKKLRGRAAFACAAVIALTSSFGFLAACTEDDDESTTKTSSNPDYQVIKNGNFEFYDDNDGIYLISSPNNWSSSALGTSSYVMSGVINTKSSKWAALTDESLIAALDYNNDLADAYDDDPDDDDIEAEYDEYYVDYNGMHSYDIPFANVADAIDYLDEYEDDDTLTVPDYIANPETHVQIQGDVSSGFYYYDDNGDKVDLYTPEVKTDSDGNYYYLDEDDEEVYLDVDDAGNVLYDYFLDVDCTEEFESSVLMVHNYLKNGNGTGQYYASSTTVTLEANTAAEISVWVKTSDLLYNGGQEVTQNRGAFIQVEQTVGSTTLDSFYIKDINTEKLNTTGENNGWVQYTVYIQACDYADTTITINLGFGEDGAYAVEGYAFFDDLVCTKYTSIDGTSLEASAQNGNIYAEYDNVTGEWKYYTKTDSAEGTTCTLLSEGNEKIFEADTLKYTTQNGEETDSRYSENYYYYIDLTASGARGTITITDGDNITIGSTVDDDDYSIGEYAGLNYQLTNSNTDIGTKTEDYYENTKLSAISTKSDILALLNITSDTSVSTALSGKTDYANLMSEQLTSAKDLPQANDETQTLLILSAMGAPYTAKVTATSTTNFTIEADSYFIISIWVKTSDMNGGTAATLNLVDVDDEDNTATITVDTTGTTTDITDNLGETEEDIYDGWVQCFFYIQNDTEETKEYYLELQFGNTTIKGTTVSSYTGGWAAFTNITTLEVNETEFGYASSSDTTASLTFSDEDNRSGNYFTAASSETDIETNITKPSGYTGVNGASSAIISSTDGISPYDYPNTNDYAGLINVDYLEAYADLDWAKALLGNNTYTSASEAATAIKAILGNTSVQPLLIVNTIRTYVDNRSSEVTEENFSLGIYYTYNESTDTYTRATEYEEGETYYTIKQVLNYGYMSDETTLSSSSYTAITVRVKVSGSNNAYIYLTDTTADRDVLSYETPEYTFWYDSDGNVLKEAPDEDDEDYDGAENIAYALRMDGLYEDDEGNLYANLYNYTKVYYDESLDYYDEDGNPVDFDDVEEDGIYYTTKDKTQYCSHRLVTSDGTRVFEYSGTGVGTAAVYYYYIRYEEDDEYYYAYDTDYEVKTFDTEVATPRYIASNADDMSYCFEISDTGDDWVTVSFLVYTGSESKSYRLELWSGKRDETGVAEITSTTIKGSDLASYANSDGYVIFDYSYLSLDESSYTALLSEYTDAIISEYRSILKNYTTFKTNDENLDYYKELVKELESSISASDLAELQALEDKYTAYYYTFTLYDTASYYPFNEETAEDDETGYDYTIDDYEEQLAFFKYEDSKSNTYTMFIDYSAVDQSIDRVANSDEDEDEDEDESDTNVWMLASSIVLVVALLFTLIAMLIREIAPKIKRRRRLSKNVYSKRKRYIKQYTKANGEIEVYNNTTSGKESGDETEETDEGAEENAEENVEESGETSQEAESVNEQNTDGEQVDGQSPDDENKQ